MKMICFPVKVTNNISVPYTSPKFHVEIAFLEKANIFAKSVVFHSYVKKKKAKKKAGPLLFLSFDQAIMI